MAKIIEWESRIGRRVRLRDLHILLAVVQCGSMAKAAAQLGVSQPSVSQVIADLEHTVGVRLLDRTSRGVELTSYGDVLLSRGRAAFDELRQGITEIQFLSGSMAGQLRIACPETIAAGLLPPIVGRFCQRYPGVELHVAQLNTVAPEFPELDRRDVDLVLARVASAPSNDGSSDRYNVEILFNDQLRAVVSQQSRWARRRKIEPTELIGEPWIVTPDPIGRTAVVEYFNSRGLSAPKIAITTFSLQLRNSLASAGSFITILPASVLRLNDSHFSLKELPIKLVTPPWPVAIVTSKNRTLSPVVNRFIDCAREVARTLKSDR
jgi:DNA-binding transcriptional LysR family regulator